MLNPRTMPSNITFHAILALIFISYLGSFAEARIYLSPRSKMAANLARLHNQDLGFNAEKSAPDDRLDQNGTAESKQQDINKINIKSVSPWNTKATSLQTAFEWARDSRVLATDSDFPRRPTWLYPDDGCYARAEVISQELQKWGLPTPSKIFAFGTLKVASNYAEVGSNLVQWWYHVVIGYRTVVNGQEVIVVLDPALNSRNPLLLKDWVKLMGGTATISVCSAQALDPDSSCRNESKITFGEALSIGTPFLQEEWNRLLSLKKDPRQELGDSPPWRFYLEKEISTL
jgi:hypothetical protein